MRGSKAPGQEESGVQDAAASAGGGGPDRCDGETELDSGAVRGEGRVWRDLPSFSQRQWEKCAARYQNSMSLTEHGGVYATRNDVGIHMGVIRSKLLQIPVKYHVCAHFRSHWRTVHCSLN